MFSGQKCDFKRLQTFFLKASHETFKLDYIYCNNIIPERLMEFKTSGIFSSCSVRNQGLTDQLKLSRPLNRTPKFKFFQTRKNLAREVDKPKFL